MDKCIGVPSMYFTIFILLTAVIVPRIINSYPNGPPLSVCDNGLPVHKSHSPQTTPSPFQIAVNATSYSPGDVFNIRIHSDGKELFKGLFLQVRPIPNFEGEVFRDVPIGWYHRTVSNTKIITCDVSQDTLTHRDPFMKIETTFQWRSPLLMKHDIVVKATILADFSTYWVNVTSQPIRLRRGEPLPAESLEKPWLREIIKTVKVEGDKKASRDLVKARFERGFKNVIDPKGQIMVHYVLNLLPFDDMKYDQHIKVINSNESENAVKPVNSSDLSSAVKYNGSIKVNTSNAKTNTSKDSVPPSVVEDNDDIKVNTSNTKTSANKGGKSGIIKIKRKGKKPNKPSMAESYYQVLVKALLKGDKMVANKLADIIGQR